MNPVDPLDPMVLQVQRDLVLLLLPRDLADLSNLVDPVVPWDLLDPRGRNHYHYRLDQGDRTDPLGQLGLARQQDPLDLARLPDLPDLSAQ